jgi:two-component system sensor histidine kinase KdpD
VEYRGKRLAEFDLDGALARRPPLILMDELAHSNAPGSRHPKRWQDVEELLDAGIDVLTTVNVQHLESLNDVVGGITGIRVGETVPDTVFDQADEVVLVDIPADELLARLKSGKVYQEQQAERASKNFFRKGNLIALRELALRRTADRIEDDVRAYRVEKSIGDIWKTGAALLACVGPRPGGEHTVRSTARLAGQLGTGWHAIYIETPSLQRLPAAQREQILKTLKLAEELGAVTAVISGHDIALAAVDYARSHNLSKIVMGRGHPSWPWRAPHIKRLAGYAPDIDLIEIGEARNEGGSGRVARRGWGTGADADAESDIGDRAPDGESDTVLARKRAVGYIVAGVASLATALAATPLLAWLDLANIAMLFLLVVVLVGGALRASAVGGGHLRQRGLLRFLFRRAALHLRRHGLPVPDHLCRHAGGRPDHRPPDGRPALPGASRLAPRKALARAVRVRPRTLRRLQTEQIFETTQSFIQRAFRARATLLVPDDDGHLQPPPHHRALDTASGGRIVRRWTSASPSGLSTAPKAPAWAPARCRPAHLLSAAGGADAHPRRAGDRT